MASGKFLSLLVLGAALVGGTDFLTIDQFDADNGGAQGKYFFKRQASLVGAQAAIRKAVAEGGVAQVKELSAWSAANPGVASTSKCEPGGVRWNLMAKFCDMQVDGASDDCSTCNALVDLWATSARKDLLRGLDADDVFAWANGKSYCHWQGVHCVGCEEGKPNVFCDPLKRKADGTFAPGSCVGCPLERYINLLDFKRLHFGSLPDSIGNLVNVSHFYLMSSPIAGTLPSTLTRMTSLEELWIFDTHISGTLPETLGKFTEMEKMYLSNNRLSGTIPDNLQPMQKLDEVDFSNNELSGSVPHSVETLARLLRFDAAHNRLTTFDEEVCGRLERGDLRYCYLADNLFLSTQTAMCSKIQCGAICESCDAKAGLLDL